MKGVLLVALGALIGSSVFLIGCDGSGSGSHSEGELLSRAGLAHATSVEAVLAGGVFVTDAANITRLYDAVNNPDRNLVSKLARDHRIAFVGTNGHVVCLAYSHIGDLTEFHRSSTLIPLLRQITKVSAYRPATHIPFGKVVQVRVSVDGSIRTATSELHGRWSNVQHVIGKLLKMWNPNDVSGCIRFRQHELDNLSRKYIEVSLSRPISFETLIVPRGFELWPRAKSVETRARWEAIRCDTIRLISIRPEAVQLAFKHEGTGDWMVSSTVETREFLGYGPQWETRLGPDLFEQLVHEMKKP